MSNIAVVNLGMPRSGTTYMHHVLRVGGGYFTTKMPERAPLHPCNSPDGLLTLVRSFPYVRFIFVRTHRPLEAIMESAGSMTTPDGWWRGKDVRGVYEREASNWAAQAREFPDYIKHIDFAYDSFGDDALLTEFCQWIVHATHTARTFNHDALKAYVLATWGKTPVRDGLLSRGLGVEVRPRL